MAIQSAMADKLFFAGDDWPAIPFAITESDGVTPDPILAGDTLEFNVYSDTGRTVLKFQKTISDGITVVSGAGGTFSVSVTQLNSAALVGLHHWDIQRVRSSARRTLGFGTLPIRQ